MATRTKRKIRVFLIALAAVLILAAGLFVYANFFGAPSGAEEVVKLDSTETMRGRLEGIGELNTAEYMCTYVQDYSSSIELKGWKIPLTSKSFTIAYDGTVKAGIADLSEAKITQKGESTIVVTLPNAVITNATIDSDSLKVYDESKNPLNQISVEDVNTAQATLKDEMQQRAIDSGILELAEKNAKLMLEAMLQDAAPEGFTVKFTFGLA